MIIQHLVKKSFMCYLGFKMCVKVTSAEWLPYLTIHNVTAPQLQGRMSGQYSLEK